MDYDPVKGNQREYLFILQPKSQHEEVLQILHTRVLSNPFTLALTATYTQGQTLAILLVDRVGRVLPMSILYLLGGICVVGLCTLAGSLMADRTALIVLAFFARMFFMGGNGLCHLVTAELIPTQVRTTGHAAASAIGRIAGACTPWLISEENSFTTIAIALGAISLYQSCITCLLPETKGRAMGTAASFGADQPQTSELL